MSLPRPVGLISNHDYRTKQALYLNGKYFMNHRG